ncbi:hypothetical protein COY71_03670 [Candidatus Micrarchaeota archaeon CG_4_10_14_0_8_um_filter_60_7]|nr:MAG: hypothetical protein COY71_03670 [Candidatus Micrarchaeota archaeon CG_4_10_14_0_8_um_filter_60_7]
MLGADAAARQAAAQQFGKKGSIDDLGFYHTVFQGKIVSAIDPVAYPEKLSALLQALELSDFSLILADAPSQALGETIVALDLLGKKEAAFVSQMDLSAFTKGTCLEGAPVFPDFDEAKKFSLEKESPSPQGDALVAIDHCFEVKGVGTVALGFVKRGTVNIHDKLNAYPLGKEIEVKSIQMNDADVKSAPAGSRVGFCLKNATSDEIGRGAVLAKSATVAKDFDCTVTLSKFSKTTIMDGVALHLSAGLQFEPCRVYCAAEIKPGASGKARISFDKSVVLAEKMLLCDLNARGLRVIGSAAQA